MSERRAEERDYVERMDTSHGSDKAGPVHLALVDALAALEEDGGEGA